MEYFRIILLKYIYILKLEYYKLKNTSNDKNTYNKRKMRNYFGLQKLLINIILMNLVISILSLDDIQLNFSRILLKFNETGQFRIYSNRFLCPNAVSYDTPLPDEVYINGKNTTRTQKYTFNETENIAVIVWKKKINTTSSLFCACSDITEIDLSNFDSSEVTSFHRMFEGCSSLISVNLTNLDTSKVNNIYQMFKDCSSLISLDLSNFDSSKITIMFSAFSGCTSLKSINLNNFNTSKVTRMENTFCNCSSLTSLDLSSFDTSKVKYMSSIFSGCSSLTMLNLSTFDTSELAYIHDMFSGCSSLNLLDLTNFDTSKVTDMSNLFYGCSSLISLDLNNFDTSKVTNMNNLFYGCSSLVSLDLTNFDTSIVTNMNFMFYNCSSLTSLNLSNFDTSKVTNMNNIFYGCSNLEYLNFRIENKNSISDINNIFNMTLENIIICSDYEELSSLFGYELFLNCIDNFNYDLKCYKSTSKSIIFDSKICGNCGYNYYRKYRDINNNNSYINCYFLEKNFSSEFCYISCKACDIIGNEEEHNCIECSEGYNYKSELNNSQYINCYENCNFYHYYDKEKNKSYCTYNKKCPDKYNKLIEDKNECIDECLNDGIYIYEYNDLCYKEMLINTDNDSLKNSDNYYFKDESINNSENYINNSYNIFSTFFDIQSEANLTNFHDYENNSTDILIDSIAISINSNIVYNAYDNLSNKNIVYDTYNNLTNSNSEHDKNANLTNTNLVNDTYDISTNREIIFNLDNISYNVNTSDISYLDINQDSDKIIHNNNCIKIVNLSDIIRIKIEYLLNNYNISYLNNNEDIEIDMKELNLIISLSTSYNQKINENKNGSIIINLRECEYKLKSEYNKFIIHLIIVN